MTVIKEIAVLHEKKQGEYLVFYAHYWIKEFLYDMTEEKNGIFN